MLNPAEHEDAGKLAGHTKSLTQHFEPDTASLTVSVHSHGRGCDVRGNVEIWDPKVLCRR